MNNGKKKMGTPMKGSLILLAVGLVIAGIGTWLGGLDTIVLPDLPFWNH
ncbi:hypothetical protein [Saccharibacillus sacchari]|uniref:Uncharacterized protein n=1 Tax=Saccharibacillus sacchari TaxID=456493 RepID=A0ACC6P9G7_9BACL